MYRSNYGSAIVRSAFDLSRNCSTTSGRARLSVPLEWCLAALGIVGCGVVYLSVNATRSVARADHTLLGMQSTWVESVAFDPECRWLGSAGHDGAVYLWDMGKRELAKVT